jgi:hypothetical protein
MRVAHREPERATSSTWGAVRVWRKSASWKLHEPRLGTVILTSSWLTWPLATNSFIASA